MAGSVRIDESRSGAGFYGPAHGGYVSTFGYPSKVSISRIEAAIIRGAFNSPTERFTSSAIKAVMTPTVKAIRQLLWTHSDLQGSSAEKSSLATLALANWNQIIGWLQEVNLLREAAPRTAPVPFARAGHPAD